MSSIQAITSVKNGYFKRIQFDTSTISALVLSPVSYLIEKGIIYLTNLDTDETIIIEADQLALIQKWQTGQLTKLHANTDTLQNLIDNNFVVSINTVQLTRLFKPLRPLLPTLDLTKARKFLSIVFYPLFISSLATIAFIFITNPQLLPNFNDLFWTTNLTLLYLGTFVINYAFTFLHETAHYVYSKIYGIQARINMFAIRMLDVISETEHYYIYTIPRTQRIKIYLSGIVTDTAITAIILVVITTVPLSPSLQQLFRFIIITQILSIAWQTIVYLKTDLYNILTEILNHPNIYEDTLRTIELKLRKRKTSSHWRKLIYKILSTDNFQSRITLLTKKEKRNIRFFLPIVYIGIILSCVMFFGIQVPRDLIILGEALRHITGSTNLTTILEGLIITTVILWAYIILLYQSIKKLK